MRALGIHQEGDPVLRQVCRPFQLPDELEEARAVAARLAEVAQLASQAHHFAKGIGLAAPQIGIARAAALLWFPDSEPFTMLNPRIVWQSDDTDEQYEGCMSFFDVRGLVPRPLAVRVEYTDLDGRVVTVPFDRGNARLVCHEIDHLNGMLYRDRMRPDQEPIPLSEYRQADTAWEYP